MTNNSASPAFSYFAKSDVGRKRKDNQDNFGIINKGKWLLAVVCDGMGGALGGDIASEIAVSVIIEAFKERENSPTIEELRNVVLDANKKIFNFGIENPSKKGLGTTLSLVLLDRNGLSLVHVGDSRVMLLNSGVVRQLTIDHTWANELKASGELQDELKDSSPMSHMLTRSLGVSKDLIVDCSGPIDFEKGDQLVLCSDGLHNYISGNELLPFLKKQDGPSFNKNLVVSLIDSALQAGGADNVTVISISILSEKEAFGSQKDRDVVESGRKALNDQSNNSLVTKENENDYFNISHEQIASRPTLDHKSAENSSPFFSFLFGVLFAAFVGVFVWFIRPGSAPQDLTNNTLSYQNAAISKLLANGFNQDSAIVYDPKFSISLTEYFKYLKLKEEQILVPPRTSVDFLGEKNLGEFDQPNRPIVWENEARRVGIIKRNLDRSFDEFEENPEISISLSQKLPGEDDQSKIYSQNEKAVLREQIFDQNEKLVQLNLTSKEEVDSYVTKLKELDSQISSELEEAERFEDSVLSRKKSLIRMKEVFKSSSSQAREQLAARLLHYDPSFEPMIRRIRLLRESRDYYANLVNKVTSSEDVILKLTSSQRELAQVEENFEADLKRVLLIIENEFAGYIAGVVFTKKLLNIERARIQRAIGFAEAYSPLSTERRGDLFSQTAAEKREFLKKYSELEKNLPTEIESKRYLRKVYLEQKKSLEL